MIVIIFIVVFLYFSYNYIRQEMKLQEIAIENHSKKIELQKMNNDIEKLEKDLAEIKSNKNISRLAREKLKMVYPDEVLYIIEDE